MKSPFPGMDPYLERHWPDVHASLVIAARNALNAILPDDLVASSEERIAVESEGEEMDAFRPDLRVIEPVPEPLVAAEAGDAVSAPFRLLAQVDPIKEHFIHVLELRTERLITVIEFVSPTNKRGEGLAAFRSKRGELLASDVSFVEIDLVRRGNWTALLRPHRAPKRAQSHYRVTIRVPSDPGAVYLHPIGLRQPLPEITIPLRPHDPKVTLKLQELLDRTYATGRYHLRLNYRLPPEPPLDGDDATWAEELLKSEAKQ